MQALFSGLVRAGSRSFQRSASSAAALTPSLLADAADALHAAAPASPAAHEASFGGGLHDATVGLAAQSVVEQHRSVALAEAEGADGATAQPGAANGEVALAV